MAVPPEIVTRDVPGSGGMEQRGAGRFPVTRGGVRPKTFASGRLGGQSGRQAVRDDHHKYIRAVPSFVQRTTLQPSYAPSAYRSISRLVAVMRSTRKSRSAATRSDRLSSTGYVKNVRKTGPSISGSNTLTLPENRMR